MFSISKKAELYVPYMLSVPLIFTPYEAPEKIAPQKHH